VKIQRSPNAKPSLLFEIKSERKKIVPHIRSISEQGPLESRRVWHNVTRALAHGRYDEATKHKNEIEDWQRRERKEREKKRDGWQPQLFTWIESGEFLPNGNNNDIESTTTASGEASSQRSSEYDDGDSLDTSSLGPASKGRWLNKRFFDRFVKK
jgi:hypothetical protein